MKKSKFLVLALAVAVMLMGAGYAYWTETLTIDGSLSTGKIHYYIDNVQCETPDYAECTVTPESFDNKPQSVEFSVSNMYPGAEATATITVANESTIPTKLEDFRFEVSGDDQLSQFVKFDVSIEVPNLKEFEVADLTADQIKVAIDAYLEAVKQLTIPVGPMDITVDITAKVVESPNVPKESTLGIKVEPVLTQFNAK